MNGQEPSLSHELEKLSDTGLVLSDESEDIRGRKVVDVHGEEIGHVSNLFIDVSEAKVRMLEIRAGGFLGLGDRHFLIPVGAVAAVTTDEVRISESRNRVVDSPVYAPALIDAPTRRDWEPYYGYFGLSPYWDSSYMYPSVPLPPEQQPRRDPSGHAGDL